MQRPQTFGENVISAAKHGLALLRRDNIVTCIVSLSKHIAVELVERPLSVCVAW
jgi:hypothetical protein